MIMWLRRPLDLSFRLAKRGHTHTHTLACKVRPAWRMSNIRASGLAHHQRQMASARMRLNEKFLFMQKYISPDSDPKGPLTFLPVFLGFIFFYSNTGQ